MAHIVTATWDPEERRMMLIAIIEWVLQVLLGAFRRVKGCSFVSAPKSGASTRPRSPIGDSSVVRVDQGM